jgi:pimeloyl-ACP methyl ester carboxylesterase
MAATVRSPPPYVLAGISFGAMIALEAARFLPTSAVVMIAGGRSGRVVNPILRAVSKIVPWVPDFAVENLGPFVRPTLRALGEKLDRFGLDLLRAMFENASPRVIRWGLPAVMEWHFQGQDPCPVRHVHGTRDRLIPLRLANADVAVPGGHLINFTQAEAVNRVLVDTIRRH